MVKANHDGRCWFQGKGNTFYSQREEKKSFESPSHRGVHIREENRICLQRSITTVPLFQLEPEQGLRLKSWNMKLVKRTQLCWRRGVSDWPDSLREVIRSVENLTFLEMRNAFGDSAHRTNKGSPITCELPFCLQSKAAVSWLFFGRFLLLWQKAWTDDLYHMYLKWCSWMGETM